MTEVVALKQPLSVDLKPLSRALWQLGLAHRIVEERGQQVVWAATPEDAAEVEAVFAKMARGEWEPLPDGEETSQRRANARLFHHSPAQTPVVVVLLVLSLVGAVIPYLDREFEWLPWLSFYQLTVLDGHLVGEWPRGQLWRLLTPIFLHFGMLHLAFNGLWLWELGGMIERRQGAVRILGVVLLVGAGSNIAQGMTGVSLFGGMSGVIYGLLGYLLAWNKLRPRQAFPLLPGVAVVMLIWLVLCIFGFTALLGVGDIANTAHVSGLVLGLLLGLAAALMDKKPAA